MGPEPARAQDDAREEAAQLERFRDLLDRLRAGDATVAAELAACAEGLCRHHARCDAVDVARHYLALSDEALARSLDLEARFQEIWDEVRDAGESALDPLTWSLRQERILSELDELAAAGRGAPDPIPAARALSLAARLLVQRLENDATLDRGTRDELVAGASSRLSESLAIFQAAGFVTPRLEPHWLQGRLHLADGELRRARRAFEACLVDARAARNDDFRQHALVGLLRLARRAGDVAGAARLLDELASFRSPAESWPLTRDHARALLMADHAEQALDFLRRHRPPEPAHPQDLAEWHLLVGGAALWLRDGSLAREHLIEARGASGGEGEVAVLVEARLALLEGRAGDAVDTLAGAWGRVPLSHHGEVQLHSLLGEALLAEGDVEGAIEELEESLALAETWGRHLALESAPEDDAGPSGPAPGTLGFVGEWLGLHTVTLAAAALVEDGRPLEAARLSEDHQSRSLRGEDERVRALRGLVGLGAARAPLSTRDLQAWAAHAELGLVTWVVGAEQTVAVHVAADGRADGRRVALSRRDVAEAVRKLRDAVQEGAGERAARVGTEIARQLLPEALLGDLRASGGPHRRLLVLAHGPLEEVPFALLEVDGRPLDELCTSVVLPGLPDARPGAWSEPGPWVFVGAPDDLTEPLPLAADELRALAATHPGARLAIGSECDATRLAAALAEPRPVHVATHLVAGCECLDWRLAPLGLLTRGGEVVCSHDIEALSPRSPLVVLSACSSGLGRFHDAEGLRGLARVLLEASTRNVVVALWPVEDAAARRFALELHRALQRGELPSRATRHARATLRESGAPPSQWAAFRLLGRD